MTTLKKFGGDTALPVTAEVPTTFERYPIGRCPAVSLRARRSGPPFLVILAMTLG